MDPTVVCVVDACQRDSQILNFTVDRLAGGKLQRATHIVNPRF